MKWEANYKNRILELSRIVEEGGAVIRVFEATGMAELYEIPQYGGEYRWSGNYDNVCKAIAVAESWT